MYQTGCYMKSSFVSHNCIHDQKFSFSVDVWLSYSYKSKLYTMFTCILSIHVGLLICVCGKWCPQAGKKVKSSCSVWVDAILCNL